MEYRVRFTKYALKQYQKLSKKQKLKLKKLNDSILKVNPYSGEKLQGELQGHYSLRLNLKDRVIYKIDARKKEIYLKAVRTHYGE